MRQPALRTIATAAFILPANDPMRAYFDAKLRGNLAKLVQLYVQDRSMKSAEVRKLVLLSRNNLRTLEMKLNAHPTLSDGEKVELQQYITRSYGSMTTFNLLFREKEEQFGA